MLSMLLGVAAVRRVPKLLLGTVLAGLFVAGAVAQTPFTIEPPEPTQFGEFGGTMATVSDVSGEGTPDLAITGAVVEEGGALLTGRVYLFEFPEATLIRTLAPPAGVTGSTRSFGDSLASFPPFRRLIKIMFPTSFYADATRSSIRL